MFRQHTFLFDADTGDGGGGTQDPPATPPANQPGPVPYERFKQVNDENNALKARLDALEKAEQARTDKEAAEQGKWQQLAEQRETELKAEKSARLRLEVAGKKGIPVDMVDRLKGESLEDLEKDADTLLQFLKPPTGPGVPPAGKGGSPAKVDLSKMTPEEIRKAAAGKAIGEIVK